MKNMVANAFSDRMRVIWYNWVAIQVLVFSYMICSFAGAADSSSKGYGFTTVWSFLLTLLLSAGGTLVLRRIDYRTPIAVGFLIGVSFMMSQLMLVVAVISGSNIATWNLLPAPSSEKAVQAFAVMLFMAYSTFTAFVTMWRDVLLPPAMSEQESGSGLPPSQATYGGNYDGGYSAGGAAAEEGGYSDNTGGGAPAVL